MVLYYKPPSVLYTEPLWTPVTSMSLQPEWLVAKVINLLVKKEILVLILYVVD